MNRAPRAAALLLALAVLPGCSEDGTPAVDPTGESTGESTAEPTSSATDAVAPATAPPTSPAGAPLDTDRMRQNLEALDTGHFLSTYELDGVRIVKDGVYRLADASSTSNATVSLPDGTELRLRSLVVDGVTYGQVDNGGPVTLQRCWFRYQELPFDDAVAPEIGVVLSTRVEGGATVADLGSMAAALGSDFVANLGVTAGTEATAPVHLDFTDGVLTGWSASVGELLAAARAAGLAVPAAAYQESSAPLTVRLDRFGDPVELEAPPVDRQVAFVPGAPQADVDAAIDACEAP